MNDILENRFSMLIGVQTFGTENTATLATVPVVPPLFTTLDGLVNTISSVAGPASDDITGVTVDKGVKRAELTDIVIKVSDAFSAYCYLNDDNEMAELFDETRSSLEKMRDTIIYTYARNLSQEATPVVLDLADYNILPADLTALDDASAAYLTILQRPKYKRSKRAANLRKMIKEFDLAMDLLKNKLDKAMKIFISIDPVLYDTYLNVRTIDDTGASSDPDYDGIVAPGAIDVIVNLPYSDSRTFKVKNTGSEAFEFSLSTTETNMEGEIVVVEPGQERQRLSSALNPNPLANFLLLHNTSGGNASFEVRIEE